MIGADLRISRSWPTSGEEAKSFTASARLGIDKLVEPGFRLVDDSFEGGEHPRLERAEARMIVGFIQKGVQRGRGRPPAAGAPTTGWISPLSAGGLPGAFAGRHDARSPAVALAPLVSRFFFAGFGSSSQRRLRARAVAALCLAAPSARFGLCA